MTALSGSPSFCFALLERLSPLFCFTGKIVFFVRCFASLSASCSPLFRLARPSKILRTCHQKNQALSFGRHLGGQNCSLVRISPPLSPPKPPQGVLFFGFCFRNALKKNSPDAQRKTAKGFAVRLFAFFATGSLFRNRGKPLHPTKALAGPFLKCKITH